MSAILALGLLHSRVSRNRFLPNTTDFCFNMDDLEFIKDFRLNKSLTRQLIDELRPHIEPRTERKNAVTAEKKVFCALRFFATGSYQRSVANEYFCSMTQQSASNCIRQVADAICLLLPKYVTFPTNQRQQEAIKQGFFDYCGLTGVIGAIDHVAIVAPSDDDFHHERNYVNRKNYHSINVQLVCDMNIKILNVVARFPGCTTHDSYVWKASKLRNFFVRNIIQGNGWLLGDSGYPSEHWLHTPFANPRNDEESRYNSVHSLGRSVIERCNGVLKNRFRCLMNYLTLHYSPEVAGKIIIACVILHNICTENSFTWEEWELPEEDTPFDTIISDD